MKIFLQSLVAVFTLLSSVQTLAITRVVTCVNPSNQSLEYQFVLRGGQAMVLTCAKASAACSENDLQQSQVLLLSEESPHGNLRFVPIEPNQGPVYRALDFFFAEQDPMVVQVWLDGLIPDLHCF